MCAPSFKFLIRLFADGRLLKQTLAYLAVIKCSNISLTRKGLNHRVSVHVMLRYIRSVVKLHVSIDWRAGNWSLSHKFCSLSATSTTCINLRSEVVGALTGSGGQDLAEAPVVCRWQITSVSQVIKCPSHARRRAEPPRIRFQSPSVRRAGATIWLHTWSVHLYRPSSEHGGSRMYSVNHNRRGVPLYGILRMCSENKWLCLRAEDMHLICQTSCIYWESKHIKER